MKLFYITNAIGFARVVSQGFDQDDCFMRADGITMWRDRPSTYSGGVLPIDLPEDVANQYAFRRREAPPDEPPLFYRLPVDVANRYLRRA